MSKSIKSLYITTGNILFLHDEYDKVIDTDVNGCYRVDNSIYYTKYNYDNKNYDLYLYDIVNNQKELVDKNVLDVLSYYKDKLLIVDYSNRIVEISNRGLQKRILFSSATYCWYVDDEIFLIGIGSYLKCFDLYHRLQWEIRLAGDICCIYKQSNIVFTLMKVETTYFLILIDFSSKREIFSLNVSDYVNSDRKFVKQSFFVFDKDNIGVFLGKGSIIYQIKDNTYNFYSDIRSVVNIEDISEQAKKEDIVALSRVNSLLPKINIAVTCHEAYLKYLSKCLASIDKQDVFHNKYLVLDGCQLPSDIDVSSWKIIYGNWGTPNPGRNAALQFSKDAEWIIYFDADNIMPDQYMQYVCDKVMTVSDNVAIIYPDIYFLDYYTNTLRHKFVHRSIDRWSNSRKNRIDMSSVWRVRALQMIGGLIEDMPTEDDYHIADKLLKAGWIAVPLETYTIHYERDNEDGRWKQAYKSGKQYEAMWRIRDLTVVTLFSGRVELLSAWTEMIKHIVWPPQCNLFVLDNSNNTKFHSDLLDVLIDLSNTSIFSSVTVKTDNRLYKDNILESDSYFEWKKHLHIAKLYSQIIPIINTDFILTVEDDVFVDNRDIIRSFYDVFTDDYCRDGYLGAIGCPYSDPLDSDFVTAAMNVDDWGSSRVRFIDLVGDTMEVRLIGGGFTLWANWAVRQSLPIFANLVFKEDSNIRIEGWDYTLSKNIIRNGYKILLFPRVIANHFPRKWKESKF